MDWLHFRKTRTSTNARGMGILPMLGEFAMPKEAGPLAISASSLLSNRPDAWAGRPCHDRYSPPHGLLSSARPNWNAAIVLTAVVVLSFFISSSVRAEESLLEREAKQAAAEDLAEKQLPEGQQFGKAYSGTFTLTNDDLTKSAVVGRYDVDNGATFLVKVTDSALLKRLALYDNKKCVVNGKVRNDGKYLIVTTLVEIGGAPPVRRKRGGL